ncbi:MAG TPA: radical SAM protein [Polyangiaceae bacterium]|nr:radical SAM protein [Polyangiaceae bacterium]
MKALYRTTSLCRSCKNALPAEVVSSAEGEVFLRKTCPEHGDQEVKLSTDVDWYLRTRAEEPRLVAPRRERHEVKHGCPFDCGPCEQHEQTVRLPVVTITSACNLDCPICYVHNKNKDPFHMPVSDFERLLTHLKREHGEIDIVNFTGGEPLLHPEFAEFLRLSGEAGVHRVTICSNGIRLARDEELVKRLADAGARVALSFDTFDRAVDYELQGAKLLDLKLRCLELLEKHAVDTTLIPVMTKGLNDHEIGRILELAFKTRCVRHVEVHTITFTGQGGTSFSRERRISMVEVLDAIAATTGGLLGRDDFVSSPCAHPLCYQIAYLLLDPEGGPPIPFSRFLPRETISECLADRLYMEPSRKLERALLEAIDRLWASESGESERTLRILKRLLKDLFPRDRVMTQREALRISEVASKAVYVHSHMDEETFDTERIVSCCDSNCYADGSTIPVCAYNVLYRDKEEHFMLKPMTWSARSGGQKSLRAGRLPVLP